jgi:hypothetical protein
MPVRWSGFFRRAGLIRFLETSLAGNPEMGHNELRTSPRRLVACEPKAAAMAFNLNLPRSLAKMRWKVKIRDKERAEDPHVTIIRGATVYRVGLRDKRFMDGGSWRDLPDALREVVKENWGRLCAAWDSMYPLNPVHGTESHDEN